MSKHTPGPWTVDDDYIVTGEGRNVAHVYTVDDFTCDGDEAEVAEECAANAALIAAAPDLLEALAGLYQRYVIEMHDAEGCDCDLGVGITSCVPCRARAALAKARGEE